MAGTRCQWSHASGAVHREYTAPRTREVAHQARLPFMVNEAWYTLRGLENGVKTHFSGISHPASQPNRMAKSPVFVYFSQNGTKWPVFDCFAKCTRFDPGN